MFGVEMEKWVMWSYYKVQISLKIQALFSLKNGFLNVQVKLQLLKSIIVKNVLTKRLNVKLF